MEKVFDNPSNFDRQNDIILCCGDFNVNGMALRKQELNKLNQIELEPMYKSVLPLLKDEYGCMIKALKSKHKS